MVDEKGDWLERLLRPFHSKKPEERKEPELAYTAMAALELDIERSMADEGYTQAFVRVSTNTTTMRFTGDGRRTPITVTIKVEEGS
ncbi:hypothetical protein WELLINGTON_218 [Erwinia phage Wellington]|uniref:Uncharacterized protein n=1 Tax=Erwinia phage Wellington TaxID=2267653 RepID=A0A345BLM3_9CAUD|nr:hypothetical protein HOT70_gp083 [Erwinia phage Wellington]AXF51344.1 hypothetical protein WELLINGTON_218 [Erwinia phage Wellington]